MRDYVIYTDSSCDLSDELIKELDVEVVQLDVSVDDAAPVANNQLDIKEFYATLRSGKNAKTNAVPLDTFEKAFKKILADGKDLLYIGFSSGLSSTYNWGKVACDELREEYPENTVLSVDTLAASLGQGMIVYLAAKKKADGASIEEVCQYVEDIKLHIAHWFTVDDLFFLKRGGRISSTTAVVGSMLSIKPVMHMDDEGHLINVAKARGRKAAIAALAAKMKETGIDTADQTVFISHGDCIDDVNALIGMIKEIGIKDVIVNYVGPVIGSHSGPGTLALFFIAEKR